jgi:hypothetical protein
MKKQIFMTAAMAATLSGCASGDDWGDDSWADADTAVCVDQQGQRIADHNCDDDTYYRGGYVRGYSWYYVGRGKRIPYYGDSIRDQRFVGGGSFSPTPGTPYAKAPESTRVTRSQAVSRGGFGSRSGSYGGGRS